MKKDNIRDYATAAFRFYDREGRPTYDEIHDKIFNEALESAQREYSVTGGISKPTEAAVLRAERELQNREAEILDILAVERTLERLSREERMAVEMVYFEDSSKELEKGDITARVHWASLCIPTSEETVWRMLRKARRIFAEERNLRKD